MHTAYRKSTYSSWDPWPALIKRKLAGMSSSIPSHSVGARWEELALASAKILVRVALDISSGFIMILRGILIFYCSMAAFLAPASEYLLTTAKMKNRQPKAVKQLSEDAWTKRPSSLRPQWHFDPIKMSTVTFCPCDNVNLVHLV